MDVSSIFSGLGLSLGTIALSNIVEAVVILVVCLIATKVIVKTVSSVLTHSKLDRNLHTFIRSTVKVLCLVLSGIITLGSLGFNMTSLVAVLSVAGLAVSLAMQNSLSNLAGGILLLVTKPFVVGDYISTGSAEGTVLGVDLAYTQIATVDNKTISVPNGSISSATIVNYSTQGRRRVDLTFTFSYDAAVDDVKAALLEACAGVDKLIMDPAPFARVSAYQDSAIAYTVRAWCATADYWDVYFDLMEAVKRAADAHGIEMTYNHLNVHMMKD